MIRRSLPALVAATLIVVAVAGCAAPAAPESPRPSASSTPQSGAAEQPSEAATPSAEPEPEALTCETMISPGTVAALTDAGWSAKPKEFVVGDVELTDGLLCFWADYSVGSDHGQLYGWSEISADEAARAQQSLLDSGWRREDGPDGVYITEDPQFAMGTDEDGYGMTYLFGDGWVRFADTRQGLLLIEHGD